jgi:hypothetical protein
VAAPATVVVVWGRVRAGPRRGVEGLVRDLDGVGGRRGPGQGGGDQPRGGEVRDADQSVRVVRDHGERAGALGDDDGGAAPVRRPVDDAEHRGRPEREDREEPARDGGPGVAAQRVDPR